MNKPNPWNETHPDYDLFYDRWCRTRDVLGGAWCMRRNSKKYIPVLRDQEEEDYRSYVNRAMFLNATARTLDAMVGMIMRKTPEIKTTLEDRFMADVDMRGTTFPDYIRNVLEEMGANGHGGTLIDWNAEEQRPYFSHYRSEDIINWSESRIGGKVKIDRLTLRHCGTEMDPHTLCHCNVLTYTVYKLIDGTLTVETTREVDGEANESIDSSPLKLGKGISEIPFVFHTLNGNRPEIEKGPLEDMVEVNISHYRTSADLENGRHIAGLPTAYAFGFDNNDKLALGLSFAWVSENENAKAGFLEFNGSGLSELSSALKEKQDQMAGLGARIVNPKETGDAEAYGTVKLRADAEQATLVVMAGACSATMSLALQWAAWWAGTKAERIDYSEDDFVVLNDDFVGAKISGPELTAITATYQMGNISWDTYFFNLQQGEVYPQGWTKEQEEEAIQNRPVNTPPIKESKTLRPSETKDIDV